MTPARFVDTPEKWAAFVEWLALPRPALAVDTETDGLAWDCKLRLVQFGDCVDGWAVPWHIGTAESVKDILESYRGIIVMHNAPFDVHVLEHAGVHTEMFLDQIVDTLLLANVHNPSERNALKKLAVRLFGSYADEQQKALADLMKGPSLKVLCDQLREEQPGLKVKEAYELAREIQPTLQYNWASVPIDSPVYVDYGIADTCLTARVLEALKGMLSPTDMLVAEQEHAVQRELIRLEERGMKVDVEYTQGIYDYWIDQQADLERRFLLREQVTNIGSKGQKVAALQRHGWRPTEFTKTGEPKLDEKVLNDIDIPLADAIRTHARLGKWANTYCRRFLEHAAIDGRVHANMNTSSARTGRMSIDKPSLQNVPKGDPIIRRCIEAGPGNVLVSVDYSQVEARIAASMAQEMNMLQAFADGRDLHQEVADAIGKTRDIGKSSGYLSLFGGGPRRLAHQSGIPLEEAVSILGKDGSYWKAYPQLKAWMAANTTEGATRGFITTAGGRRLPVDQERPYAATNYRVQGSAAEVLKRAILRVGQSEWSQYMILPVHDELLFECPEHVSPAVKWGVEAIMQDDSFPGVSLPAEGEILGRFWGKEVLDSPDTAMLELVP